MSHPLAAALRDRRLVVFDVDGTLYDQSRLRRAMAARLLLHLARSGRVATLRALAAYRRAREASAGAERTAFEAEAIAQAAQAGGMTEGQARDVVAEWMHRRPLPLLARCRYDDVAELFAALRGRGTRIGILSDYPAAEKLAALGLDADAIAHAGELGIDRQKPDPSGLRRLMEKVGADPAGTILIGDRDDRDGEAGRRAGVDVLIRADRPAAAGTFRSFASLIGPAAGPA